MNKLTDLTYQNYIFAGTDGTEVHKTNRNCCNGRYTMNSVHSAHYNTTDYTQADILNERL